MRQLESMESNETKDEERAQGNKWREGKEVMKRLSLDHVLGLAGAQLRRLTRNFAKYKESNVFKNVKK